MRVLNFCALIVLIALPALAERIDLEINPAATKVNWTLGDVLHTVRGTFKLKKSDFWFDAAGGKAGGVLIVDATSGDSGSNARDSRMHKNVLESDRYPEIIFVPDRVEGAVARTGDSEVKLHGMFTIHGGTHEVLMKVKCHRESQALNATVSFTVPYVKWGLRDPSNFLLRVKNYVDIDIEAAGQIR